jgi:predicted AAA+ superfamily ATPase
MTGADDHGMIRRELETVLLQAARQYPVLTVVGPRQSGKTTLCRKAFPEKPYVTLESADTRDYARSDPRGLLAEYRDGAIFDEIQNAPELTSYLQGDVDERPEPGRFVLTGSQNLAVTAATSQSLAGRTAVLRLLPTSLREVRRFENPPSELIETLWAGSYPRIHDRGISPRRWLDDYVTTYLQRDVRQLHNVGDLEAFSTFLRHAAARTAQEVNLSSLGGDAGVTHNTARSWLSVLEASFLCIRVPAWHRNLRKQLVKAPKLHFLDSGLVCRLLGIQSPEQLRHHPLRGAIFESWVTSEILKTHWHAGLDARLFHFRDAKGLEVDLVLEAAEHVHLVECKSGATVASDALLPLQRVTELLEDTDEHRQIANHLVFGGDRGQHRSAVSIVSWSKLDRRDWTT